MPLTGQGRDKRNPLENRDLLLGFYTEAAMKNHRSTILEVIVFLITGSVLPACQQTERNIEAPASTSAEQTEKATHTSAPAAAGHLQDRSQEAISVTTAEQVVLLQTLDAHSDRVSGLDFSPDGHLLASGSWDGTVLLWDVETWRQTRKIEHRGGDGVHWTASDTLLAMDDGKIWDVLNDQEIHTLDNKRVFRMAISPDGSLLATANADGSIDLRHMPDCQLLRTLEGHTDRVFGLAFSPDGSLLASGSGIDETDTSELAVRIWDVASGRADHVLKGHSGDIHDVVFSPDSQFLASASIDYTVRLWNVQRGELIHTLHHGDGLWKVAFSPDGALLVSGGVETIVRLWDVVNGHLLRTLAHEDEIMAISFSPDGSLLATGGYDHQIYIWGMSH